MPSPPTGRAEPVARGARWVRRLVRVLVLYRARVHGRKVSGPRPGETVWRSWWSVVAFSLIASAVPAAAQPAAAPDDPVPLEADLDLEWGDPLAVPDELEPTCDDPPCGDVASTGEGGYIAITPARLLARRGLRPGVVDVPIAGVGGIPEVGVGALVLNVAVRNVVDRSSITLYPPERTRPARPNLQVDATRDWSTLAVVEVATSGAVALHSSGGRVDVEVDVLGWFPRDELLHPVPPTPVFTSTGTTPAAAVQASPALDTSNVCTPPYRARFTDIAGSVHADNILCMADQGLTQGVGDGARYAPRVDVTRGQMASFIARFIEHVSGKKLAEGDGFRDVPSSYVHAASINKLARIGVTAGTGSSGGREFAPQALVDRGQMASFISRALTYLEDGRGTPETQPPRVPADRFPDDAGSVHEANIDALAAVGIVTGFADGRYRPRETVKRDQMASFVVRALSFAAQVPDPPADPQFSGTATTVVTGRGGVPSTGVGAVVLSVTSSRSSEASGITLWPTGGAKPAHPNLVTEPGRARSNLVIVPPGTGGEVTIASQRGRTDLVVEVLGWLAEESAYRPVPASGLLDTRAEGGRLASGQSLELQVAGRGGVPARDEVGEEALAYAVVLDLTTPGPAAGTAVAAYPAGVPSPDHSSLLAGRASETVAGTATVTLAMVPLGEDGRITLTNRGVPTHLVVQVVGWFTLPASSAELVVPDTTQVPEETLIESVGADGTIELAPGAEPIDEGGHVVLGVTTETPEGYLGTVESVVTAPDGSQRIETTEARLEEVFPEGDIVFDTVGSTYDLEDLEVVEVSEPDADGMVTATAQSASTTDGSIKIDFEFPDKPDGKCDLEGAIIKLGPTLDTTFRVKWRAWSRPLVTSLVDIGGLAQVEFGGATATCEYEKRLKRITRAFAVGGVPVVIVVDLGVAVDVAAGLEGLRIGANARAGIVMGVLENKGHVEPYASYEYTSPSELAMQARNLTAYAMGDLWFSALFKLYGVIGPSIALGPFVETRLTTATSVPWWAFDFGFAGKITLTVDLWFVKFHQKLFEAEIPLAAGLSLDRCVGFGPGSGTPCRTPAPEARVNGAQRVMADRVRLASSNAEFATLRIDPITLEAGAVGESYSAQLRTSGLFSGDTVWKAVTALPPGIRLDTSGRLHGTPITPGSHAFTVEAWYGPEVLGATTPPYGPAPPPRTTLTLNVAAGGDCAADVFGDGREAGDQLRAAIASAPDGAGICLWAEEDAILVDEELVVPDGKTLILRGTEQGGWPGTSVASNDSQSRVLRLGEGSTVRLERVGLVFGNAGAEAGGGALVGSGAHLDLAEGSFVAWNRARAGGGIALVGDPTSAERPLLTVDASSEIKENTADSGGGIHATSGDVILDGGAVQSNRADGGNGGGIQVVGGTLTSTDASFAWNTAPDGRGGALSAEGGAVVAITGEASTSDFYENHARSGGALALVSDGSGAGTSRVTVSGGVEVSGFAATDGGAIDVDGVLTVEDRASITFSYAAGDGGGIVVRRGSVVLDDDATMTNNQASRGGAIAIAEGSTDVTVDLRGASTITRNTAIATDGGGGIFRPAGQVTLWHPTLAVFDNEPDDVAPPLAGAAAPVAAPAWATVGWSARR
jgi:hypothetical protein